MKGIEAMKRHVGKSSIVELKHEDGTIDEIEFGQLPLESFPEYWGLFSCMQGFSADNITEEEALKFFNKDNINTIIHLLQKTIRMKYNKNDLSDELMDSFIQHNFFTLMVEMFKINSPKVDKDKIPERVRKNLESKDARGT